jgi:hypothetical protein
MVCVNLRALYPRFSAFVRVAGRIAVGNAVKRGGLFHFAMIGTALSGGF